MLRRIPILVPLLLAAAASFAADIHHLGSIDFPNSGRPEAQEAFIRGVLLLHSFEYDDAREAFVEASGIDPDFALAYWGEAMTHNHPLWRRQHRQAAKDALERLAPTPEARRAKAETEREKGYLAAVEILFGYEEKIVRDAAYEETMRRLAERHPEDLEARSFYALSILGTTQGVRDFRAFMRAAAVAEEVFAANPRHPGALHYLIHSYDDPVHAPLGLRPARVYAEVAPAASHAQHMISHIFVALGRWEDSVEANVTAFEVSRERAERKDLPVDELNFHALHWLEYSYLQLGRLEEARDCLDRMGDYAAESHTLRALRYNAAMRATWAVATEGRNVPPSLGTEDLDPTGVALDLYATGLSALAGGQTERAEEALTAMRSTLAGGAADGTGDAEVGTVLAANFAARIALAEGDAELAVELLVDAAAIEGGRPLEYGPPSIAEPSHELLGATLLGLDRPDEARAQIEIALERAPRRSRSLTWLAEAAARSGDQVTVDRACGELASIRAEADDGVGQPAVCGAS